jgi:hypothetical protein
MAYNPNTEYTEDVAAVSDPKGGALIMVRQDTLAAVTNTNGDNVAVRGTNKGELYVKQSDAVTITGTVADDATTPGAPVMVGGKAVAIDGTDPTTVSEDDVAIFRTDLARRLLISDTHPRFWHAAADYGAAQTNTSFKTAPGASLSIYITDITVSNGATAGTIQLLDGSGGTVLRKYYVAITGGAVENLRTPIKLTANTALAVTSTSVSTHSVSVGGYIAP